jgi:O-antigen ligase
VLGVIGLIVLLWSKIQSLLGDYFARGFDSNGRYELWAIALKNFADCPIFGRGFSGFESVHKLESGAFAHMGPMPTMAHNTLFELLSATGIVGTLAYGYYRVVSLIPVFKRPTLQKTMLALSLLVTLGGSLLDNFVFNLYPMYFAMVTLAMIHRADPV